MVREEYGVTPTMVEDSKRSTSDVSRSMQIWKLNWGDSALSLAVVLNLLAELFAGVSGVAAEGTGDASVFVRFVCDAAT